MVLTAARLRERLGVPGMSIDTVRIDGLDDYLRRFRDHIVEQRLLPIGTHRRNWKHTRVSDGFLLVRHPDWDRACAMADAAATDITMYAE
jgi:hypothetical protein